VTVALAVTFVAMTSTAAYSGVVQAAMQNVATPQARATAAGLFATVVALIGQGVLPYAVGLLSDALRPALHESSLRWSITVMACLYSAAATVLFLLAWRATRAHFARAALEDPGALALARAADAEPAR
jgi:O-antigen/teichoic acid export membrane protein